MTIRNATPADADLIADAILDAIGPELTSGLAGVNHTRGDVHTLFSSLAAREDTQYSFRNSRIAINSDGTPMGVCISYDGADLISLRRPFFQEANHRIGWNISADEIDALPGETAPDEFYLDTLMTLPEYRGKGVASALIRDAKGKAEKTGKPLGLLCDTENPGARKLYDSLGFRSCGQRPFAGHLMNHLQL